MKRILITGASGGMGLETVKYLSMKDYYIYALDIKPLEEMKNVKSFIVDLTKKEEIEKVYESIKEEGPLDALIYLSGMYYMDSLIEISEETLKKIYDINFFSVYNLNKIFMPLLNKSSRIVIITSELAPLDPLPFNSIYSLSKSALDKYAEALRQELNLLDIDVVVIRPGAVNTSMIPASITNIERMEKETKYYQDVVYNFKDIVVKNESKTIEPIKISKLIEKTLIVKRPKLVYKINNNPKLKMLSILPKRMQLWIIKKLLKKSPK